MTVTGEEQQQMWLDFDLDEELTTMGAQIVPDSLEEETMVTTSAEVCAYMNL